MIRVGPAGWSYDDWQGIVYPAGRSVSRLRQVAAMFGTIEINSSFYRPPRAASAEGWVEEVGELEGFRFTAKLVRAFTHEDEKTWTLATRDDFRDGIAPLWEAGLLGAVLVQFPWFFAADDRGLRRLERIRKAFPQHPLVLEVRHRSWLDSDKLEHVSGLGYSFCNMDMPQSSTSIALDHFVTGSLGYLRLHGRNAVKWFDKQSAVHEKYDYYYDEAQILRLLQEAVALRERTEDLYVVANNHFEGQGPANALEIQRALTGRVPTVPETLVSRFPRLKRLESS